MPLFLLCLLLLTWPAASPAASANGCDLPVRLGQKILRLEDSQGQALDIVRRADRRVQWLRGPKGRHWSLRMTGRNPRSIQLSFQNGRMVRLCQYKG